MSSIWSADDESNIIAVLCQSLLNAYDWVQFFPLAGANQGTANEEIVRRRAAANYCHGIFVHHCFFWLRAHQRENITFNSRKSSKLFLYFLGYGDAFIGRLPAWFCWWRCAAYDWVQFLPWAGANRGTANDEIARRRATANYCHGIFVHHRFIRLRAHRRENITFTSRKSFIIDANSRGRSSLLSQGVKKQQKYFSQLFG